MIPIQTRALIVALASFAVALPTASAESTNAFDGRPWNISSGNLSVSFIQASPIGSHPHANFFEPPPSAETLARVKNLGLVADEDYVAWGAVERQPGNWDWRQHDAMEQALHAAGMKYVVYDWLHFPPGWLRDEQKDGRTLMRCLEHGLETHYLSVFDPRTIDWYDRFYRKLKEHFGNKIDDVYACVLGPYGEGNYPLFTPDWINMGHCHEGYWCGDEYAIRAFQAAMKSRYNSITRLNFAWGTRFKSFNDVRAPQEITEKFKPSPEVFNTPQARRRWLDFITWYHQAIIDFAGQSAKAALKYFPAGKVRQKPGGSAGGVNPIAWGTYCPGYAKTAGPLHITLQPADCQGAVFADKWMGTAYQFYGVKEGTEPAGNLSEKDFVRRMFSDAAAGASQFFTYEFEQHAETMQRYVRLFTGKPGETEVAVYCPTTLYRLGASLKPTIDAAYSLRDLCDFDVLDELLIEDGALQQKEQAGREEKLRAREAGTRSTTSQIFDLRYKALLIFQAEFVDVEILKKMETFLRDGGRIIQIGSAPIANVEGKLWPISKRLAHVSPLSADGTWLRDLANQLSGLKGMDGQLDKVWTCRRGSQVFVFNSSDQPVVSRIDGANVTVQPHTIWLNTQ